ncbi:MAG: hypothetical protein O2897_03700 [bacterium]|nr:hypothetical protein [bacterium]
MYKISWTNYILNQFHDAAEGFANLLDYYQIYADKSSETASVLKSEAEEYLAISFADMRNNSPSKVLNEDADDQGLDNLQMLNDFFQRVGKKVYERSVYIHFADVLIKYTKLAGAKSALEHAIELDVYDAGNPAIMQSLAHAYAQAGKTAESIAIDKQIVQNYSPDTEWFKQQTSVVQKGKLLQNQSILRDALLRVVLYEHAAVKNLLASGTQKEKFAAQLKETVEFYLLYIKWFVTADNIDEILFYLAEANFDLDNFSESAFAFAQVRDWPWETKYRQDAAINVVFSYAKAIDAAQKKGEIPAFDLAQIEPANKAKFNQSIPSLLLKWQNGITELSVLFPNNPELVNFLFQSAGVDYTFNKLDAANHKFQSIITLFPDSKAAYLSAKLVLEDKVANGLWFEAGAEAAKFKESKIGEAVSEFQLVELNARFKEAEALYESAKKLVEQHVDEEAKIVFIQAAELYSQLFKEFPRAEIADKILYNAAIAFELGGLFIKAETKLKELYQDFPKSSLAKVAMLKRAQYFENILQFNEAAALYEYFSKTYPKDPQAQHALLNAAVLYEAFQEDNKAITLFKQFSALYPNVSESQIALSEVAKLNNKSSLNNARTELTNLQSDLRRFNKLRINAATGKRQGQQLIKKTNLLATLQKKYQSIAVKYPESSAELEALFNIGVLYEGLYQSLIEAPCPKDVADLGEEECDEYKSLLEDKAFVLQTKAVKAFNLVQESSSLVLQKNDWSLKAGALLNKLKPDEYPVSDSYLELPLSLNFCAQSNLSEAKLALAKDPSDSAARFSIIEDFYNQGKLKAVVMALDDSAVANKNNACWYTLLGKVESRSNNNAAAMKAYLEAASLHAADKVALGKLYWLMADLLVKQKEFKLAAQKYIEAMQYDAALNAVNYNLGLLYMNHDFAGLNKISRLNKASSYFKESLNAKNIDAAIKEKANNYLKTLSQRINILQQQNHEE